MTEDIELMGRLISSPVLDCESCRIWLVGSGTEHCAKPGVCRVWLLSISEKDPGYKKEADVTGAESLVRRGRRCGSRRFVSTIIKMLGLRRVDYDRTTITTRRDLLRCDAWVD